MVKILSRRAWLGMTTAATVAVAFSAVALRLAVADTLDDVKAAGTIKVGVGVMGTKPWVYQNEDGSYAGMEYEMLKYILPKLGIPKFEYVSTEWDSLIPGLKAKRWDIIFSGMTITEERRQGAGIEFTRPYYFESDRIVVKKDSPFQKPEDLAGKTLAAPIGTIEEYQAKQLIAKGIGKDLKSFNDNPSTFLALQADQVDAVIMDNTTTAAQAKVTPNLRTIGGTYSLVADEK